MGAQAPYLRCDEDSGDGSHREHPLDPARHACLRSKDGCHCHSQSPFSWEGRKEEGSPRVQLSEESGL